MPGTHNGLKSIIQNLSADDFIRVRVGVGKPNPGVDLVEYVIGYIPEKEKDELKQGIEKAKDAVITIIQQGVDKAMSLYN